MVLEKFTSNRHWTIADALHTLHGGKRNYELMCLHWEDILNTVYANLSVATLF